MRLSTPFEQRLKIGARGVLIYIAGRRSPPDRERSK